MGHCTSFMIEGQNNSNLLSIWLTIVHQGLPTTPTIKSQNLKHALYKSNFVSLNEI